MFVYSSNWSVYRDATYGFGGYAFSMDSYLFPVNNKTIFGEHPMAHCLEYMFMFTAYDVLCPLSKQ